eukprot:Opistho-2@70763
MVPSVPGGRVDIVEIKNRLNGVLGDHSASYWESLRNFTRARLTKGELDKRAKACLGDSNVSLHNEFIRAILVNAQSTQPPPDDKENAKKSNKRKLSSLKDTPPGPNRNLEPPTKSARLTPGTASAHFSREYRAHVPRVGEAPPIPKGPKHGAQSAIAASGALIAAAASVRPPPGDVEADLCTHAHLLPDAATLRARSFVVAFENGLDDVEEGVAETVQGALEFYLKDILSTILSVRRNPTTFGNAAFVDPHVPTASAAEPLRRQCLNSISAAALATTGIPALARKPKTLCLEDLALAVELHPHILNGDIAGAERIRSRLSMPPPIFAEADALSRAARQHQEHVMLQSRRLLRPPTSPQLQSVATAKARSHQQDTAERPSPW